MRLMAAAASAVVTALVVARAMEVGSSPPRHGAIRPRRLQGWLVQAGLGVTPSQFLGSSLMAGAAAYLVVFGVTSLPVVSLVPAVVVATLPRAFYGRRRARRLASVAEAWPDGLRDLISSVASGSSLVGSLEALAANGPLPLREAFGRFPFYSRSVGVVAALEMICEDLGDPTSDRVIEILILAQERGGTVVPEILRDLAAATTRDVWALEQVRTESLEQKINARVVFVLPWVVLMAITARPGAFRDFYATPAGLFVVLIGGVLSLVGMAAVARIGRIPTEPRVLGPAAGEG